MNAKDALRWNMDTAQTVLTTYLSDLSDEDLLRRPAPAANHIAWQLGHLISSEHQLVSAVCPGSCPELPEGFADRHGRDATGVDDSARFLRKAQYLELFERQRRATKQALDKLPDADLDRPGPKSMEKICPTVGAVFGLVGGHVLMHVGQFATLRRLLGKPVLI